MANDRSQTTPATGSSIRTVLRGLDALAKPLPPFDTDRAPDAPTDLFLEWLDAAVAAGQAEPHAMTLSTVDENKNADARVLLLKDVVSGAWHFATSASSPKGRQLAGQAQAALTFYWPLQGRQIRLRGGVVALPSETGAADFRARSAGSRAVALLERQSEELDDRALLDRDADDRIADLAAGSTVVPPSWTVYALTPLVVEFWQGRSDRRHTRLQYRCGPSGWVKQLVWP